MPARPRMQTPPLIDPTVVDIATEVTALLIQSMGRHRDYQQAIRDDNIVAAFKALIDADACRRRANELDPTHAAPAWRTGAAHWPHDQLLTFYEQELDALTRALAVPESGSA